jgi:hypothetical protein
MFRQPDHALRRIAITPIPMLGWREPTASLPIGAKTRPAGNKVPKRLKAADPEISRP